MSYKNSQKSTFQGETFLLIENYEKHIHFAEIGFTFFQFWLFFFLNNDVVQKTSVLDSSHLVTTFLLIRIYFYCFLNEKCQKKCVLLLYWQDCDISQHSPWIINFVHYLNVTSIYNVSLMTILFVTLDNDHLMSDYSQQLSENNSNLIL